VPHDVAAAAELAERFVAPLGRRWRHVQKVAAQAEMLAAALPEAERDDLISAAWLHDVGYSPELADTGLHALDGARFLQRQGWPPRVVGLVAHHSGARFEATERGLLDELSEFPFEDSPLLDALALADLTTGPAGERVSYEQRIEEILRRYPAEDPVHRTWLSARPTMAEALERSQRRLAAQPR
jgi:putative nucleotidyltransferase with HDIG domain